MDWRLFGALECDGGLPAFIEEKCLGLYAIYIVYFPRVHGKTFNTAAYAECSLSALRDRVYSRHNRYPGGPSRDCHFLRKVLRGLHKLSPSGKRALRLPIQQFHLRAVRRCLDLKGNALHRAYWALWLTQWQGVCRSGDLIRSKSEARRPWDISRDTHRGRLSGEWGYDTSEVRYRRLTIALKPTKTDPSGEENWAKSFRVDFSPSSLSAGAAITEMLSGDPAPDNDLESVPLFRNPMTGMEITYAQSDAAFRSALSSGGFPELATGLHSLRIGGGTAIANEPEGGDFIASCVGLWTSDCRLRYFHAIRERIEAASFRAGRGTGGSLAVRPGPLSMCRSRYSR